MSDLVASSKIWPAPSAVSGSAADRLGLAPSAPRSCRSKMAELVLQLAAAAGSNYWLECGKWGQMRCIITEPVDSGSLSQWLVINKIIGERLQRFLEFFLICMSFCAEFFTNLFIICEGWLSNNTAFYGLICLCTIWGMYTCTFAMWTRVLQNLIFVIHSHLLPKWCSEPEDLYVWMSHKPSWAAFYPVRSASRFFSGSLSSWECQPMWIHYCLFFLQSLQ